MAPLEGICTITPSPAPAPPRPRQFISAPNLDCTGGGRADCECWTGALKGLSAAGKLPPIVAVTLDQGAALRAELAKGAGGGPKRTAFVQTQLAPYRKMSGTSMATCARARARMARMARIELTRVEPCPRAAPPCAPPPLTPSRPLSPARARAGPS